MNSPVSSSFKLNQSLALRWLSLAVFLAACGGDESDPSSAAGSGGSGGSGANAGTAGSAGVSGSAGAGATGATGGSSGVAGSSGSGGTSGESGSSGSGGSAGTGGSGAVAGSGGSGAIGGSGGAVCGPDDEGPNEILPDQSDPEAGDFTMDEALAGLPEGPGPLRAIITTDLGIITCELRPDKTPIAVANFVGLARGRRAFRDPITHDWVRRRFYDGLTFHRVIPEFMAQGGDPAGTGSGGPGFSFANEITDLSHTAGAISYANTGFPNTNGSQFFITETDVTSLDGDYSVFGHCDALDVVTALTHVPTDGQDKPIDPLYMQKIEITRCAPQ